MHLPAAVDAFFVANRRFISISQKIFNGIPVAKNEIPPAFNGIPIAKNGIPPAFNGIPPALIGIPTAKNEILSAFNGMLGFIFQ
ncbi:MAG: hypothetical protein EOM44_03200 [Bacteroidia bacterium]|nr:hypothetical protein [Bacteroidia bacterium]